MFSLVRPLLAQMADRYAAKGNAKAVCVIHMCTGILTCSILFLLTFLGFAIGSSQMEAFLNLIPAVVTDGLSIATGLLPALGFAMLARMIMNKNVVLSRDNLERHIWSYDYEGSSNMIDVYIRYLRKKIDEKFEPKLIHTVRGVGYVLKEEK